MLMKGLKQSGVDQAPAFKDAGSIPAWAAPSVAAAVKLGIISGYGNGTFKPQADITHAEMIAMVVKASGLPTDPAAATGYADDASVPAWVRGAAAVAGKHMLLGGLQGDRFQPGAKATRAKRPPLSCGCWRQNKRRRARLVERTSNNPAIGGSRGYLTWLFI